MKNLTNHIRAAVLATAAGMVVGAVASCTYIGAWVLWNMAVLGRCIV